MSALAASDAVTLRPKFDRLVEQFVALRRSTEAQKKRLSGEVQENDDAIHRLKSLETSIIGFYQELERCDPTEPTDANGVSLRPRALAETDTERQVRQRIEKAADVEKKKRGDT